MTNDKLLGYQAGNSFIHKLSGASKLLFFVLASLASMISYDTRLLVFIAILSLLLLGLAKIPWKQVSLVIYLVLVFALLNIIMVYLFSPHYGDTIYGKSQVIWKGLGAYDLTQQELFYLFNLVVKYLCTVPLALVFLFTTHPSQFASSLNQIGVPYRIAYAVSLTLRYIPDIQEEFIIIKLSQEARGLDLSRKTNLFNRIKGNIQLVAPLIFASLQRIDTIAIAMELRRFGKGKKRTWYTWQPISGMDVITICIGLLLVILSLVLIILNHGRFYNPWL